MDITHFYWCIKYDTFEVFTCTADMFVFLYWSIFNMFIVGFAFSFFFSLGAAIGYLMHIFFFSLHFLCDKGLLLPSSMQSAFKDYQFCLFWSPVFSTRIRLQIVVSSLDLKPATFWTCSLSTSPSFGIL